VLISAEPWSRNAASSNSTQRLGAKPGMLDENATADTPGSSCRRDINSS